MIKRSSLAVFAIASSLVACGHSGQAEQVTPATFRSALKKARAGSTITLAPGRYEPLNITERAFRPALKITGPESAVVAGVDIVSAVGVRVSGFTVDAAGRRYGVNVSRASDIELAKLDISGAERGIVVGSSRRINVLQNRIHDVRSDGIDFSGEQINIVGNAIERISPAPLDHPDCIQGMAIKGHTQDILIQGNRCDADAQGVFLRAVGGFEFVRIRILGNVMSLGAPNGIFVKPGRDVSISGNTLHSSGKRWPNGRPVRTGITFEGAAVIACNNTVDNDRYAKDAGSCAARP